MWRFCSLLLLAHAAMGTIEETNLRSLGMTINKFALDLHRQVATGETNVFMSPYSIAVAMAMTYAGTDGTTRSQIEEVLGYDDDVLGTFSDLHTSITTNPNFTLTSANGMFMNQGTSVLQSFMDVIRRDFSADTTLLDFSDSKGSSDYINTWVANHTRGLITDLMSEGAVSRDTLLVLVNAIYFRASWDVAFNTSLTTPRDFHLADGGSVSCDMMHRRVYARVGSSDELDANILEMSYKGGDSAMYVILPNDVAGLPLVENNLSDVILENLVQRMRWASIQVAMPKFSVTHHMGLVDTLSKLRLENMFSPNADFSRMTPADVSVTDVIHQAFVNVNEEGTEAAAATAVIITKTSAIGGIREFIIDRPFLFMIRHKASGTIIFLGHVGDPSTTMMTRAMRFSSGTNETYSCHLLNLVLTAFALALAKWF